LKITRCYVGIVTPYKNRIYLHIGLGCAS
jgi:hypothetical protein